jgi:hypothetical protein
VAFVDLRAHVAALRGEIDDALARVLDSGRFILGPEVEALEGELAARLQAPHCVAVANGTEALQLALEALGLAAGDEVVTSPLTAAFTALAILRAGGRPVFADVDPATLNLAPEAVARALTPRTRAVMPVHLYGHPADLGPLLALSAERGVAVVEDACQAVGARYEGRPVGCLSGIGALSFYPTKNLGALGDGGAVLLRDADQALRVRQLRNGGQSDRYRHEVVGLNSRLDEMQAAVLRVGLRHLPGLDGAPARAGCRLLPRAGGREGHAARGAAVRHGGVPPVRGPAPAARRAHGPAEGARRGDPHPLPLPAPPATRLRLPPGKPGRLSGGRGGRARDPVPPAPSRDDRRRRPLRGRGGAGAVIAHIVPAAAAVLAAPFLFLVPGLVVLALVRREDRQALEPDEGLFLAVALSVMASAWVGLVLAEAGRFSLVAAAALLAVGSMAAVVVFHRRLGPPLRRPRAWGEVLPAAAVLALAVALQARPSEYVVADATPARTWRPWPPSRGPAGSW